MEVELVSRSAIPAQEYLSYTFFSHFCKSSLCSFYQTFLSWLAGEQAISLDYLEKPN